VLFQALGQSLVRGVLYGGTGVHYDIHGWQFVLMHAKGFANQALYAIAPYRIANGFGSNRKPQAGYAQCIPPNHQRKKLIRVAAAFLVHPIEIGFTTQALRRPETKPGGGQIPLARADTQTASRLRPLARRRANTKRPLFVAMRARKPCVRLRCRLLG
jgi:hypothetical protein